MKLILNAIRYDRLKRILDVAGAILGLLAAAPLMSAVAVMVVVLLGRPVLFKQNRPGKNGRVFSMYKFRSMRNVDQSKGLVTDEQRLTTFGRALRSSSLDELPTLAHVLRGEMSMVGPRPLLVSYLPLYTREQSRRHEVRPGITGLAQVNGRNALEWNEKFALDVEYVQNRNLKMDAQILARTVVSVFSRRGISSSGHATSRKFMGTKPESDAQ